MSTRSPDRRAELLERAIRLKKAGARAAGSELVPRPEDVTPRLGELQRGLWLAHQIEHDSAAYNLASVLRLHGSLDPFRLQRAFEALVSRHRILRSTYSLQGDIVRQVVHEKNSRSIVEEIEVGEGKTLEVATREARRPFDLEEGPLVRLLSIGETSRDERLLLLVMHHILADERSLEVLWTELSEAYDDRLSDTAPRLQYDDFVHWQDRRVGDDRRQGLDFWRQQLEPLPDALTLPFEEPTGRPEAAPGHLLGQTLNAATREGIRRLAAATGASPFMVFCFAFRLLLQRYASTQRFALATPVSTRSHPATADMVGYFLNPVVLTAAVDEEHSVDQAIRQFSQSLKEALAHASVPFHELTEEISPPRQSDRHPIFQTMFVHRVAAPPPVLGGLQCEPVELDLEVSKFDLTLFVSEGDNSLEIAVEYRSDRFARRWMERLLDHYTELLEGLAVDLARTTAEVSMLTRRELKEIEMESLGASLDESRMDLLPRQIVAQARRAPEGRAVVCGGRERGYGELEGSARSIALALAASGVELDDRVGIFVDRSIWLIDAVLGCHLAGAAYVPLDPGYPEARSREALEDAEVRAVLTIASLRDRAPVGSWSTIEVDRLTPADTDTVRLPDIAPETLAYILYTSGSTGRPKGVVVSHGNLRASTAARLEVYDTPPGRFLLLPSIAFDSSVAGLFWTLGVGVTLVIPTEEQIRDPRQLSRLVRDERVNGLLCVPSLYARLLNVDGDDLQGLETVIVAGESCPPRLVADHFRCLPRTRLYNEYGPTEATVWATVYEATPEDAGRPVAIGRPIPGVRVEVLDAHDRWVPTGIPGAAWISGPTVSRGYWRRRELTEEQFVPRTDAHDEEVRYRTGDRMKWTEDGRLLFLGRSDDQIKLRGFRIEPGEIEAALLEIPGIRKAAVVARTPSSMVVASSDLAPVQLVAFVEQDDGDVPTDWRRDLAQRLPDHMIPGRLVPVPDLPRLPNGKIDRRHLQTLELEHERVTSESPATLDSRARALLSLWQGLLAQRNVELDDNFFELGGHSLLAVELTLAVERDLGLQVDPADVFENPTVRQLLGTLERRGEEVSPAYEHLYPIQPIGRQTPFIVAIPHFFTEMFAKRFRGERPVYGLRGVGLRPEGNLGRWETLRELGEDLVAEIQRRFPDPPYLLAGYSFGASMAVETARQMEACGIPVRRLILIAPMPVDTFRFGPFRLQIDGLRQPLDRLSSTEALRRYLRSNNPLTRRPYQRAWRWWAVEPWRRLLCGVGRLRRQIGLPLTERILYADVRVNRFRLHADYRPEPIRTPTVIFNARESESDAAATWQSYFQGPLTVHPTPDPHLGGAAVEAARQEILRHLGDLED